MTDRALLPWLAADWDGLARRESANRLPHAMLVTGPSGVGKTSFCHFAARAFLCSKRTLEGACGECESCKLIEAETHPDFLKISPADGKSVISVDQVRALIEELELTPQCSTRKIAVIDPAECMNMNAANGLLKTLEEPGSSIIILLVCTTPGFLPATIRSRCQSINLHVQDASVAISWLHNQGLADAGTQFSHSPDAPLNALALADGKKIAFQQELYEDVLAVISGRLPVSQAATKYGSYETRDILGLVMHWVAGAIKGQMGCTESASKSAQQARASELSKTMSLEELFNIYSKLQKLNATDSSSFKTQTVLEGLFADMRLNILN